MCEEIHASRIEKQVPIQSFDWGARVVARLRRGWIGIHMTTGVYSEAAQLEMVEDQYSILLINELDLIKELCRMARDDHSGEIRACIDHILGRDAVSVTSRWPEEILLE
ncbi:hypothetical protein [Actinomadura alba]|uniref:Restriction endonuclease n=1 Tax=Actinomadura alba TaxID=406431 RepID=A0ABR7LQI1_9ACTN|nr:hypothetical protein [Actinomadura alba]MBC6466648.1 hypothetical protein [Actinomadura alba]